MTATRALSIFLYALTLYWAGVLDVACAAHTFLSRCRNDVFVVNRAHDLLDTFDTNQIYLNDRSGGFPQVVTGVELGAAPKPVRAVVGDFAGDGSADDIYLISESADANEMLLRN
eukprot:COSAG02_NODE_39188_length_420_cov_0.647975_1_plen_114_part_10